MMDKDIFQERSKLEHAQLDDKGREINNPKPLFVPGKKKLSQREIVGQMVQQILSNEANKQGWETFEESNDFDIKDPFEMEPEPSRYELVEEEYIEDVSLKEENPPSSDAGEVPAPELEDPPPEDKDA